MADFAARLVRKPKHAVPEVHALDEEGLVVRYQPEPRRWGRGKPRYGAELAHADRPETQDAYLSLSSLLLEILASGLSPREVGRMAGGLLGKEARSHDSSAPDDTLVQLEKFLESRGFMPKQIGSMPEVGFVLGRCPYEQAALANPAVVCSLHRALAEGMLESFGGTFEVTDLVARHPTTAGCRLDLHAVGQPD
jgi:predicted ArsR family transcriptional regulator